MSLLSRIFVMIDESAAIASVRMKSNVSVNVPGIATRVAPKKSLPAVSSRAWSMGSVTNEGTAAGISSARAFGPCLFVLIAAVDAILERLEVAFWLAVVVSLGVDTARANEFEQPRAQIFFVADAGAETQRSSPAAAQAASRRVLISIDVAPVWRAC